MTAQITKKQHYIPQFVLRNFSPDKKKKTINVFNLVDHSFDLVDDQTVPRERIEIKKRFQKEFFYDTDNLVENFLDKNIETPASEVIRSIVEKNNFDLSSEERSKLFLFISSQLYRTPEALKQAYSIRNSYSNQIVQELFRLNDLDENLGKEGGFVFDNQNLISMSALDGAEKYLALSDLEITFAFNKTSKDFYISDHPVFSYNWLYRKSSNPKATSIFARGLQIFFPVSYNLTLCFYDPEVYKYGHRNQKIIEIESSTDVDILNSFQISNARFNIGFRSPSSVPNLKQLYKRYGSRKIYDEWETSVLSKHEDSETEKRTSILLARTQLELKRMPSFVKIRKTSKKDSSIVSFRNPLLAQAYLERDLKK